MGRGLVVPLARLGENVLDDLPELRVTHGTPALSSALVEPCLLLVGTFDGKLGELLLLAQEIVLLLTRLRFLLPLRTNLLGDGLHVSVLLLVEDGIVLSYISSPAAEVVCFQRFVTAFPHLDIAVLTFLPPHNGTRRRTIMRESYAVPLGVHAATKLRLHASGILIQDGIEYPHLGTKAKEHPHGLA